MNHHIWVNRLRKFGRKGAIGHQPIDGVEKRGRGGEEFDTDEIAVERTERRRTDVPDARIGDRGLAVEHQADRLNRLDRERLMGFDQRAVGLRLCTRTASPASKVPQNAPNTSNRTRSRRSPGARITVYSIHCHLVQGG